MSTSLYAELWEIINTQQQFIALLVYQLSSIYANAKVPRPTDIADLDYQKMTVDELPKVVEMEKLDYKNFYRNTFIKQENH